VLARAALAPFGGTVVAADEGADLPYADGTFALVSSRHPTQRRWSELARVLAPSGIYLSQGIGSGTNRELAEAMLGPGPDPAYSQAERAADEAVTAGLEVLELQQATTTVEFFDVAAVVYFLRKVRWTVPDFSVARFRPQLADVHARIQRDGRFVSHSQRFLIEARKPG
jgi:SAM-dependent methyltransferase